MISREIPGLPGIFGEGTADDDYLDIRVGLSAACSWRPNDEEKPALRAVVRIFRNGELRPPEETAYESFERAREEWREGARLKPDYYTMPEDLPGLGEEAYFTLNLASMGFGVKVRSENAIVTLTLSLKNDVTYNLERRREVLRAQRSNAIAAARDVLDDLR